MTQTQKKDSVQYGESTLFICPDDDYEYRIAQKYVQKRYPQTPASLVREIPVDRLQAQHVIIPLYRTTGCTPALVTDVAPTGQEHLRVSDPVALAEEVVEAAPLQIKDYWTVLSGPGEGVAFASVAGTVSIPKLFGALSARLRDPICIKGWRSDVRHLKLGS